MRGKQAKKRVIEPDPKFHRTDLAKFINYLMQRGKKTLAQRLVYSAFEQIATKTKQDPLDIFDKALRATKPMVEVKSRRIGGSNYLIPIEVRGDRQQALSMKWLIEAARNRAGRSMADRLADEFVDASEQRGEAVKKREDIHKMAEANRAFAHFA